MIQLLDDNIDVMNAVKQNDNTIVFSSLREFYHPVKSKGFSIKYVIDGIERYILNGSHYPIETGKYLLSNFTSEGHVEIESNKFVKGICINISPTMISEIVGSKNRPDTAFSDLALGQFFSSALFLESCYDAKNTHLGKTLLKLQQAILNNHLEKEDFSTEFFYTISEQIIADQIPIFKQLQAIPSIKLATKKDLFKRVSRGKEFIDATFVLPLSIETIAHEACMSEYHFFRLFKSVFNQSPNQYIIQKRLKYAFSLLKAQKSSVSMAAIESGFSDIHAFSKAFKHHFGYTPSSLIK